MPNKRKHDTERQRAKRERRTKRSQSEPASDTNSPQKREALKRLFGRICSVESDSNRDSNRENELQTEEEMDQIFGDENEDPILESVPVDIHPEQLGFLVCAQETLRFLNGRGIPPQHPVFTRLRLRLIRGMDEIGMA